MSDMSPEQILQDIWDVYEHSVAEKVVPVKGLPVKYEYFMLLNVAGKVVTASDDKDFSDCVELFHMRLSVVNQPKQPGVSGAFVQKPDPLLLYIPTTANMPLYQPFSEESVIEQIQIIRVVEDDGKRQGTEEYTFENASFLRTPEEFCGSCYCLPVSFSVYEVETFEFKDGKKQGVRDTASRDFRTGGSQK